MKFVVFAILIVMLGIVALLCTGTIQAHHKFGHDKGPSGPVLTVDTPVFVNASFNLTGSGFKKESTVYVGIKYFCCLTPVTTDSSGDFVFSHAGISAGTYIVVAAFFHKNGRFIVIESAAFTVS